MLENYVNECEDDTEPENPFPSMYRDESCIDVDKRTNIGMIVANIERIFKEGRRWVVLKAKNGASDKVVSSVEVFKSKFKAELHQWTKMAVKKRVALWKCVEQGARDIRVNIEMPVLFVLISLDPFPGSFSCMSMQDKDSRPIFRELIGEGEPKKKPKGARKSSTTSTTSPPNPNAPGPSTSNLAGTPATAPESGATTARRTAKKGGATSSPSTSKWTRPDQTKRREEQKKRAELLEQLDDEQRREQTKPADQ